MAPGWGGGTGGSRGGSEGAEGGRKAGGGGNRVREFLQEKEFSLC